MNGMQNGEGVTRWPDGKVFTGIHEADKIKQGKLTYPNGDYMDGTFRDGKFWEGKRRWTSDAGYTYYNDYKNGQEERCTIL